MKIWYFLSKISLKGALGTSLHIISELSILFKSSCLVQGPLVVEDPRDLPYEGVAQEGDPGHPDGFEDHPGHVEVVHRLPEANRLKIESSKWQLDVEQR